MSWERWQAHCPQGKAAASRAERVHATGRTYIQGRFRPQDYSACGMRTFCTQAPQAAGTLTLHPRVASEPRHGPGIRAQKGSSAILGALVSKGRGPGAYVASGCGRPDTGRLANTHLQYIVTAAASHVDRLAAWIDGRPRAKTRTSRFAARSPA